MANQRVGGPEWHQRQRCLGSALRFRDRLFFFASNSSFYSPSIRFGDPNGKSDPYVIYGLVDSHGEWVGKHKKTDIEKKTLCPIWTSSELFRIESPMAVAFKIECWDWDVVGADDFMGQAIVPLAELTQGPLLHTLVLDLLPRVKERATGCIQVLYKYETVESMKKTKSRSQSKAEIDQLVKHALELENREFLLQAKFFVEQAADKFVQCTQNDKLETAEQVAQFLHSQGLLRYIYTGIGLHQNGVTDPCFTKAIIQDEVAKKWRAAAVRIFTDNNTGVTFDDICRVLKYFWDSKDIRSKASLQFRMMNQHNDGQLSYKEVKKHMSMLVNILVLLLKFKIPGLFKADKSLRKTYSDDEFIELAQKISTAVSNAKLSCQFADMLFSLCDKDQSEKISKAEYKRFYETKNRDLIMAKVQAVTVVALSASDNAQADIVKSIMLNYLV